MWPWPSTSPTTSRRASVMGGWGGSWPPRVWMRRRLVGPETGRGRSRAAIARRRGAGVGRRCRLDSSPNSWGGMARRTSSALVGPRATLSKAARRRSNGGARPGQDRPILKASVLRRSGRELARDGKRDEEAIGVVDEGDEIVVEIEFAGP